MKTIAFEIRRVFPDATHLKLVNEMAALQVLVSEDEEWKIFARLPEGSFEEDFSIEDYIKIEEHKTLVEIELEDISDVLVSRRIREFKLELHLPKLDKIELSTENFPMQLMGLDAALLMNLENGPALISNCSGSLELESENGSVKIHNYCGDLKLQIENGAIFADGLTGDSLEVESENGAIKMRSASFKKVSARTENGMIYYESLPVEDAHMNFESENGTINLVLAKLWAFEIKAETETGMIKNKLDIPLEADGDAYVLKSGEEGAKIVVKTENGSIKLSYDEHLNLDFLRKKLEQLKDLIAGSEGLEDKEQAKALLENIIDHLDKALAAIPEDKIKDSIKASLEKLKELVESLDLMEAKDKALASLENIANELNSGFHKLTEKLREKYSSEQVNEFTQKVFGKVQRPGDWFEFDSDLGEKISKKVMKTLKKVVPGAFDLKEKEKEEIAEQSRIKILQMLESGKISADDAERLLKAISKD